MVKKQTKLIKIVTIKGSGMSLSSAWLAYMAKKLGYKITYDALIATKSDSRQFKALRMKS